MAGGARDGLGLVAHHSLLSGICLLPLPLDIFYDEDLSATSAAKVCEYPGPAQIRDGPMARYNLIV